MLVCEDAWHSLPGRLPLSTAHKSCSSHRHHPREECSAQGRQAGTGTIERWERLARDISSEHGVFVALVQLVGTEGGKIFSGGSMVAGPKGDVKLRAPLWEEAIITATLDTSELTRARVEMPLLTDLQTMLPHLVRTIGKVQMSEPMPLDYDPPSKTK